MRVYSELKDSWQLITAGQQPCPAVHKYIDTLLCSHAGLDGMINDHIRIWRCMLSSRAVEMPLPYPYPCHITCTKTYQLNLILKVT